MKNKLIAPLFCIATVFAGIVSPQEQAMSDGSKKLIPSSVKTIRIEGWRIPRASYTSRNKTFDVKVDDIPVRSRTLTPTNSVVDYENYFVHSAEEVRISTAKRRIVAMSDYSYKGSVFAYVIRYEPYRADDLSVSALFEVKFIDYDGDGVFETRIQSIEMPQLPDWVKSPK